MSSLSAQKSALRDRAKKTRDELTELHRVAASSAAAERLLALGLPSARVALFSSRGSEIDPRPLESALRQTGALVAFPRVEGSELCFAAAFSETLVPGGFGLLEPSADAPLVEPASLELILVPGLLYSGSTGHRIGYGKGYFDRALGALVGDPSRPLFVGYAFERQIEPSVPFEATDIPVDLLVTEARVIPFSPLGHARVPGTADSGASAR